MSGTPTPKEFHELTDRVRLVLDEMDENFDVAYREGFGRRHRGDDVGRRGRTHSDPTAGIAAVGSRARGACRLADRYVRDSIREPDPDAMRKDQQLGGSLTRASAALAGIVGGEEAKTTDVPNAPSSETKESLAARRATRERRLSDPNPLTRDTAWGDA